LCCHQGIAEKSIRVAIAMGTAAKASEAPIQRHAMCLVRRGASTNRRSRMYSSCLDPERERTER
jgi:hypothetical protein